MGLRVGKSFKIAKGVRLNLSTSGVGMSVGGKIARYSVHSSGRRTTTIRAPGTGISYVTSKGGGSRRPHTVHNTIAPITTRNNKPGLFAPKAEKELYRAIKDGMKIEVIDRIAEDYPKYRNVAYMLADIKRMERSQEEDTAILRLQALLSSNYNPTTDPFARRYLTFISVRVGLPSYAVAALPLSKALLATILSGPLLRQERQQEALKLAPYLRMSAPSQVILAELYTSCNLPEKVIELTDHEQNTDETSMLLLTLRGRSFATLGHFDAALTTFKEALRYPSRPIELRKFAWLSRAKAYIDSSKMSLARRDLERIMAEDSSYPGLDDLLQEAGMGKKVAIRPQTRVI